MTSEMRAQKVDARLAALDKSMEIKFAEVNKRLETMRGEISSLRRLLMEFIQTIKGGGIEMTEAQQQQLQPVVVQQQQEMEVERMSDGGSIMQYNIFNNIFQVTTTYKPPILPIGKGACDIVCSALNSKNEEHVALKKIANALDNNIDAKRILQEIKLLRHMDHENVVAIRDIVSPSLRDSFNTVYTDFNEGTKLVFDPGILGWIFNEDVVTEFIEGLVETYPGLQYLDGFPEVKVVLRADVCVAKYDKVVVISGGGSGHEPAHAGFVGEGMLTAAIGGEVFAFPQVDAILAGIRAVTGPKGCLLNVKNYTGDRLNFGLAAEQAKAEGFKVETVIIGEDCALPPPLGIAGRRGLAGTILVHKVAGAAADAGLSLEDVAAEAKHASEMVGTMGVALSVCSLPGQVTSDRLGPGKMELGLGMHGEPGAAVADIQPVEVVVSHVLKQILSQETKYVPITRGNSVVLMVNGLGGTPPMELMIVAGKAVPQLQLEQGLVVDRVYTGSFMTSLDMAGFSISVMKADEAILQRLDAGTKAPFWPVGVEGTHPPAKIHVPLPLTHSAKREESLGRPLQLSEQGRILEAAIEAAASAIIDLEDSLNEWDSKVGDGDCGSTMFRGATAIFEDVKNYYPLNDAAETINEICSSIRRVMGGTSGIIYTILLTAGYAKLRKTTETAVTAKQWAEALEAEIAAVCKYGGASAGYRTLLDALIPASAVLQERLNVGDDPSTTFIHSSEAAVSGAESTIHMQAQAGRSTYVSSEMLASAPDPGAMAAASWYRAAALAVKSYYSTLRYA